MDLENGPPVETVFPGGTTKVKVAVAVLVFLAVGSYLASWNYLLFHSGVELFSVVISFTVLVIALNTHHLSKDSLTVFLGIAYGFVGFFDFLHALAYNGMGVFPGNTAGLSVQIWICARYIEALSLVAAPLTFKRRTPPMVIFLALFPVSVALLLLLFATDAFPVCFIPGQGLTPFKVGSELAISTLFLLAVYLLFRHGSRLSGPLKAYLGGAYIITALAELLFSLYTWEYDLFNTAGHLLKLASFYLIYKAVVETGLRAPYHDLELAWTRLNREIAEREAAEKRRRWAEQELIRMSRLDSIGILAGGIAHDFNNLLAIIAGNVSLAKLKSPDGGPRKYLDKIEQAATQAADLTQQLLTFAKGGKPVKKPADVGRLLRETANLALGGSNAVCELDIGKVPPVEADEGQLRQVFSNILINAGQAMPRGGTVRVRVREAAVPGGLEGPLKEGRYVEISIADEGVGIPGDQRDHIFDPFFTTKERGHGLGLSTSYSIIRQHGGHITVESEVGAGSTFTVYLPVALEPVDEVAAVEEPLS